MEAEPQKRERRWFQFSLRTLMLVVLIVAIGMAIWIVPLKKRAERQRTAVEAIKRDLGSVLYDYGPLEKEPSAPRWLRNMLGDDFFTNVDSAEVNSDDGMMALDGLDHLSAVQVTFGHNVDRLAGHGAKPVWVRGTPEKVTDDGLAHLARLTHLKGLLLQGTSLTDAGVASIKGLTELNILELDQTSLTDSGLEQLKPLSNLGTLSLRGTKVTDAGMKHLSGFANLYILDLGDTNVSDAGLAQLEGIPRLEILKLDSTMVTDTGLEHLKKLPMLDRLDVRSTKVTAAGVKALQRSMPKLFEIKQ